MENACSACGAGLTGRQTKFCSLRCKNADTNHRHQNYVTQQERGRRRRLLLIESKGGRCERCGYQRNGAALAFRHLDPSAKAFGIDMRKCSNASWRSLVAEASKCMLLCLNCHAEVHNPDFST